MGGYTDIDRKDIGCEVVDPIHLAGYTKQESVLADTRKRTCPTSFEVLVAVHLRIPFVLETKLRQQVNGQGCFEAPQCSYIPMMEMFLDITTLKDEDASPRSRAV